MAAGFIRIAAGDPVVCGSGRRSHRSGISIAGSMGDTAGMAVAGRCCIPLPFRNAGINLSDHVLVLQECNACLNRNNMDEAVII
ncbi:hypothetical protein [Burkholderia ubonensis]|uniref:hypothetical protein n=2 Tax=Burkholderia ubonensis TaxID=101571 RepID=UPI000AD29964|nr:hypothetical protein [Burkholderia ubonensis]